ncbi:MAG: DUF3352 domain-containing protein [Candidatus Aminicenantes bacterium]|nr:DUF3352 domain-containing protein [Candidatus Aminicenantes bacterium]
MKRNIVLVLCLALILIPAASCAKKGAGASSAESLLGYLPQSTNGVIVMDMGRIMNTDAAVKAIQEEKMAAKYKEFIEKTGIDPQKDIHFLAVGMTGDLSGKATEAAVILNMDYKKDDLLAKIKAEAKDVQETTYSGVTLYTVPEKDGDKPAYVTFLSDAIIAGGTENAIKSVIDTQQKKTESILKNEALAAILKGVRKDAMVWSAFAVPAEAMEKAAAENPMMGNLKGLYGVTMLFDYKNKGLVAEIKGLNKDEAKNKELATMLDGLKAMGAMASSQEPALGEVLEKIVISSGPDAITISAELPEDLLNKLKAKAEEKAESLLTKKPETETSEDEIEE